ncbi:Competence protein CoiA-like family, contains a predicted nuclease domain [Pelagirhabdus alkalitolerans]|uniref:Competence protein CoiA-like family, contains a predicted nuclease domain n=1 Tax=Pelagirhabdus alkalitolerans TaxID=1612202 RepID=A0A1G6KD69_9BACI|nr:competence protein CoiA family protein [Pelagirhabdus alkalitolerans]SDC29032.1 Competence protein CoiA-like family, contains a predicted nuclease domain [Pelagirhabdus alkalitolerans]
MLLAITKSGDTFIPSTLKTHELQLIKKQNLSYYCPACKERVVLRAGLKQIAHFAHRSKSDCDNLSKGEGKIHEQGKKDLYNWLKAQNVEVSLEHYIQSIKQRADLFVKWNNRLFVIEYQCAKIPIKDILKRTYAYQSISIMPIWILGAKQMKRLSKYSIHLTKTLELYLHSTPYCQSPLMYFYCPIRQQFAKFHLFAQTDTSKAIGLFEFNPLRELTFFDTPHTQYNKEMLDEWYKEQFKFRFHLPKHCYGKEKAFRNWLYHMQLHPSTISSFVGLPIRYQLKMNCSIWDWQSRLCYVFINNHKRFSYHQVMHYMRPYKKSQMLLPLVNTPIDPVKEYLDLLIQLKILTFEDNMYFVIRRLKTYCNPQEALKGDKKMKDLLKNKVKYK